MVNHHFGEIGDVWKHLPLAEILALERPRRYWESHAGSALYPLTRSWQREYGIYYFLDHASASPLLASSRYRAVVAGLPTTDGYPSAYPGSAMLALLELGRAADEYILCDLDHESIVSLRAGIRSADVGDRAHCVHDDGIAALWERAATLTAEEATRTMVHIDPFDPFDASGRSGLSAVDLCCALAGRGCMVLYWYGLETADERSWAWHTIAPRLRAEARSLWCGEVALAALHGPTPPPNPGVRGCGVLCVNISSSAVEASRILGSALAALYHDASWPGGQSGALDFVSWPDAGHSHCGT
jgi:23S rRNA (adenine2030-N6)-methyltransferase